MEPGSGGDHYITWAPHPDREVERIFRDADQAGYTIMQLRGVYMLVTPDGLEDYYFVGHVVSSSGPWRQMVRELRGRLEQTARRAPEGQV